MTTKTSRALGSKPKCLLDIERLILQSVVRVADGPDPDFISELSLLASKLNEYVTQNREEINKHKGFFSPEDGECYTRPSPTVDKAKSPSQLQQLQHFRPSRHPLPPPLNQ